VSNRTRIVRSREWAYPVPAVHREVLTAEPAERVAGPGGPTARDDRRPPVLFVPGFGHGAWVFGEHWLDRTAARGFLAAAVSPRGHGRSGAARRATLRAYAHDVVQAAAALPRRAVLVGHGAGALVVAYALARYPARAAVLVAPVLGGPAEVGMLGTALLRNPLGTLPALVGGPLRLRPAQLFSRELPEPKARGYAARLGRAAPLAQWQLLAHRQPEPPVGDPPVLVLGSPDDRVVPPAALTRAARRYGGAPLLFPGMGHDMMLDARRAEPIDAILDWLDKGATTDQGSSSAVT
jgi:pimeloyl-ACP methyl ester carboxylesterase